MNQEEYDRLYKKKVASSEDIDMPVSSEQNEGKLNIRVISRTPSEQHEKEMSELQEKITIVGKTQDGMDIIRRSGGADTSGNEAWRQFMRRCGRLKPGN